MKCPRCNADISASKKCGKCGFNVDGNLDELEVEYKDFKTSELLEIRHRKQITPPGAETKEIVEQSGGEVIRGGGPANPSPEAKQSSFPILAVVVLILALIIGGLFLVRFLVLQ